MIEVVNGNPDKALRELSRALQVNGVIGEVKSRSHYLKPCQKRAMQKAARLANIRRYTSPKASKKFKPSLSIFSSNLM